MILLIDNYDSFVYNLARYLAEMGCRTQVSRNDRITVADVRALGPAAIVLSPGPCTPCEAGISIALVRALAATTPILGVCLGHQSIAAALGGKVIRAPEPFHGRTSLIVHQGSTLFAELPNPLKATRYHSLIVEEGSLPPELTITARTTEGIPMALTHREWPLYGVQFHPESVLTQYGHRLLRNFLRLSGIDAVDCPSGDYVESIPIPGWTSWANLDMRPLHW